MNSIKGRGDQMGEYSFQFPEHHKNNKEILNYSFKNIQQLNITEHDIEKIINCAFETAQEYVSMVNMTSLLKDKNIYSLPQLSKFVKAVLSKSCSTIVDYSEDDDSDKDSDDDEFEDDEDIFDDEDQIPNIIDEYDDNEGNIISNSLSNISQQNFKGCRIYDRINPQQMKKYFRINIDSSVKYIHKQTACWLLTTSKSRLSNDRLQRVQGR
ncbi:unnamed protein product [Rotaria sp. Silwood1]|nr:unnamed protein product [Rotaria sp. Silwood1]CAF1686078.1 unnamed protein product [Rotaria sp. Silwood1]CAF3832601.1 unnamed protein product [Rotaria sp. Silwood1]CAF3840934.1 unnamed protein product [Rotaria sp. Silwood1]CAF3931535.1 unnamed protein product [Rotaria sp. Silwood1]